MSQKVAVTTMILALILSLGALTFVFSTGPDGQFDLLRGLLITAAILVVSGIIVFFVTALQWWIIYR